MAKFKKEREFRQAPSPPQTTSAQLSRKSAGKVLILESRAPSRLLHNSSSRVTPLSSAHTNEARLAQRKLVFPPTEACPHLHGQPKPKKRMASSLASRRLRSPSEAAPIKTFSRVKKLMTASSQMAINLYNYEHRFLKNVTMVLNRLFLRGKGAAHLQRVLSHLEGSLLIRGSPRQNLAARHGTSPPKGSGEWPTP